MEIAVADSSSSEGANVGHKKSSKGLRYFQNQTKFYRLLFWCALIAFLVFGIGAEAGQPDTERISKSILFAVAIFSSVIIIDAYLIPKLFQRKQYFLFLGALLLVTTVNILLQLFLEALLVGTHPFGPWFKVKENIVVITPWIIIALLIFLTEASFKRTVEKTQAELNYLKQQINPHFLLNTHNNIFFLIEQNPSLASEMLLKLSGIMKYTLYECNGEFVSLERELENIRDYIELERIRKNENVRFQIDIGTHADEYRVAPLILMTFVENAFKHVSNHRDRENYIVISIDVKDHWLTCQIRNSAKRAQQPQNGGIGLENAKKRLSLLYPKKHQLAIENSGESYDVFLKMALK
ncbi:MAG: sensor histidine kinase [Chitinophagaceae bacterium]|nr:sensor histidine kinase [Chitinophagaceae bacterium]